MSLSEETATIRLMPKKRNRKRKPQSRGKRTGMAFPSEQRPPEITLGGPRIPSRGWAFAAMIEAAMEAGLPVPTLTPRAPDGYSSDFCPQPDSPRAPFQAGWYLRSDQEVPIYIWVFPEGDFSGDQSVLDLRARGFARYVAHSVCTNDRGDYSYASAEQMEAWTPILMPDPSLIDCDHYGAPATGYTTPTVSQMPSGVPRKVGVLDVDYARVAGQRLPEHWDIDVVGLLIMERQEVIGEPGREFWRQAGFYTFRDFNLSDLNAAAENVDLIIGHNLFDGDYRCLRTYGDAVDVNMLVSKTVDTLYFARHLITGGFPRSANLGLTALARAQGLRDRAKKQSRTKAHRSIRTIHDAEENWFFQPISDDCELMMELWLELITKRRLRNTAEVGGVLECALNEDELRLLLEPQLTSDAFIKLLTTKGTVYKLQGAACNESVARIHREIERQRAVGASANRHVPATHRQRCIAPGEGGNRQCTQLIPADETYCRSHQAKRRCRGNPALEEQCATVVNDDYAHCRWHRQTALYVQPGQRLYEDFIRALPLAGWHWGSDWGYDTGTCSFFARLYRNGEDLLEPPTAWLVGINPDLMDVAALTDAIQAATGKTRREVTAALRGELTGPQDCAVSTQSWEPTECGSPCPCGTPRCGHGEPCPNDECSGHDLHVMRNPRTERDVTAWQDTFDCCEGCGSSSFDISLPERPWGELHYDGTLTVYTGVSHYELGLYP